MTTTADFLGAIQSRAARIAVGPSTVRGQGVPGIVAAGRGFLRGLDLRKFGVSEQQLFSHALDRATEELRAALPAGAQNWGIARKLLNIFLRDSLYTAYLRAEYHLDAAEAHYELPLDSITAGQLYRQAGREQLPRWPGVKRVTPDLSSRYQAVALRLAQERGIRRVHLDAFWWSVERDKDAPHSPGVMDQGRPGALPGRKHTTGVFAEGAMSLTPGFTSGSLLDLMQRARGASSPTFPASYDLALRLDVPLDRGLATLSVLDRLDEVTVDWLFGPRLSLLNVVTTMAAAEKSRAAWNPKKLDERYRRLAIEAVKSARLAKTLSGFFPHPSDEIRLLIGQLIDFMEAAVVESLIFDHHLAARVAHEALSGFRSDPSTSRVSNIMLADLVELALGRKPGARGTHLDESGIRRRYLRYRDKRPKTSASAVWKRSWKLLAQVAKLPPDIATRFDSAMSAFGTSIRALLRE